MNTNNTPHTVGHVGWSPDYKSSPMPPGTGKLIARRSAAACSVVRWISVADKLPDDDITVLIADTENDVTLGFHDGDSGWRYCSAGLVGDPVTHWAEIPDPPNVKSAATGSERRDHE